MINSVDKEAGLESTFIFCECGEKITFLSTIAQLSDKEELFRHSKISFINTAKFESGTGLT